MATMTQTTASAHVPELSQQPLSYRLMRQFLELSVKISPALTSKLGVVLFSTPIGKAKVHLSSPTMQQARRFELAIEGGHVAMYEWGDVDAPVVLLVHGWRSKAEQYRHMVQPLLDAGYRVAALDLPAHGYSSGSITNPLIIRDALRVVGYHYGSLHGVIAHSFGTYGVVFLMQHLPNFPVENIVLMGGPDIVTDVTRNFAAQLNLSDDLLKALNRGIEQIGGASAEKMRSSNVMATCSKRGLVIHDRQDQEVDFACGERIAAAWNSAELYATDGLKHHGVFRDETTINHIVEFLNEG